MSDLLEKSPEFWARDASLPVLQAAAFAAEPLDEQAAAVLDHAYLERSLVALGKVRPDSRTNALALAEHLERIAHDSSREELEQLSKPYFARWRTLAEMMHRAAMKLDVSPSILGRKYVKDILVELRRAGGSVWQSELRMVSNEGQRSAVVTLMAQWGLVERQVQGTSRKVAITDLGLLSIADVKTVQPMRPAARLERGCVVWGRTNAA